ncbi:hypothetical protein LAZ67_5003053 [Cordylochernes scorpioides]|uniref:Histone-lysine N-methyltransferase SETMAR n=1 Tax=Cordylochernes scorpioides TaxID=51811 RepID=A0ABY6KGX2_9ARAC|nr:hypothetical protein LAZ67_5003053 [Cordylochernes scorpioides]
MESRERRKVGIESREQRKVGIELREQRKVGMELVRTDESGDRVEGTEESGNRPTSGPLHPAWRGGTRASSSRAPRVAVGSDLGHTEGLNHSMYRVQCLPMGNVHLVSMRYVPIGKSNSGRQHSTPISTVSMPRRNIRAHYEHMSEFETGRTIGFKEAACRPLQCLPLTPVHRQVRLQWCRGRSTWNCADWGRIVFSGESRFLLCSDDRRKRVWRRPGLRVDPGLTVEHLTGPQQGVMVWGAISFDSKTPLVVIPGTLTAKRWIPHFLNLDQKLNRIRVSKALLKRYEEEDDHFLDQIVTGDESWCYHYDPSTKRASMEWKRGDSPRPKKISPDLASSDYFLFGLLKKELKGKRFDSDEDVQKVVQDYFHTLPKSAYKEGIYKLPERWRRCI